MGGPNPEPKFRDLDTVKGPYASDDRLSTLTVAVWHISDHYGQLVEYLRMNSIVPPASR